jgi:hypothetical protein
MGWFSALDEKGKRGIVGFMPRAMRVEYPGAIYHVMDRGDRQKDIRGLDEAAAAALRR